MRLPLAALAVALIAAIGFVPLPAIGAAAPDFSLSCGSAAAGGDVPCTISRASAGKGLYVLFQTADGSAHAGTDYTSVKQLLYFKASALSQTVAVHTAVNPDAAGTLMFNAAIAASTLVVRATGSIVEPSPIIPIPPSPPPPPSPTPIPSAWVPAPLAVGGFAFVPDATGPMPSATPCCNGLIVKVVAQTMSTDVVPVPIWWVSYFTDTRGEVANPDQFRAMIGEQNNLQGVAPAP